MKQNIESKSQASSWGGRRVGAGRKSSGGTRTYFMLTSEEKEKLKVYLACIRKHQDPVLQETIREKLKNYRMESVRLSSKENPNKPAYCVKLNEKGNILRNLIG